MDDGQTRIKPRKLAIPCLFILSTSKTNMRNLYRNSPRRKRRDHFSGDRNLYKSNLRMSDCIMQIRTSLVFTATLTLFATVTALSAQQIPAIAQDLPPDKEFPASTEAPDIPSH